MQKSFFDEEKREETNMHKTFRLSTKNQKNLQKMG